MTYPGGDEDRDGVYEADGQLTLADDDGALPWLESDEDEPEPASDYRILIFAALAVAALVAILFAANHFLSGRSGGSIEPDGSTIEAPDGAYKERPEDAGGLDVAGTGDLSFEVGEGEGREGQIASNAPAPSISVDQPGPAASPTPGATPSPARTAAVGVQVGAYSTRAAAEAGWSQLAGRFTALQGASHRVVEGTADSGTIYRLQAIAGSAAAADQMCRSIRNAGGDCQVKR